MKSSHRLYKRRDERRDGPRSGPRGDPPGTKNAAAGKSAGKVLEAEGRAAPVSGNQEFNHRLPGEQATLTLNPGRERSLLRRHPWIFSGAVDRVEGPQHSGETVTVRSAEGRFLAWAALSPKSNIRARVWSFAEAEVPGEALFRARIRAALALRARALPGQTPNAAHAMRVVHSEADGLPGLIADRYGDVLVVQISSSGAERRRDVLLGLLREETGCRTLYERSDADVRKLEGLESRCGFVAAKDKAGDGGRENGGGVTPEAPASSVVIEENGLRYRVDYAAGQKTGFFLDQRDNRQVIRTAVESMLRAGVAVDALNCFCYTGGFSLSALAAGAQSVMSIDSSGGALAMARDNLALNGLDASRAEWIEADVFRHLRVLRDAGRSFDLIVLDPPKFAPTARDAERAARGYKDINLSALKLLRPGGLLATFSCSGGVSTDLFQKIVAGAAADAGVSCGVEHRFEASPDHPVLLEFPEGEYLKGLLLRRN